jgi:hypothetical protein
MLKKIKICLRFYSLKIFNYIRMYNLTLYMLDAIFLLNIYS